VRRLVARLPRGSPEFARLWDAPVEPAAGEPARHEVIDHPAVGRIAVDCDAQVIAGDDRRVTVYTAERGTEDAEPLQLAIVLGTQSLVE
jgi:hypothetical protein